MALNALEPILIFQFYKLVPSTEVAANGIPVAGAQTRVIGAVIPIYLSDKLTGLFIDGESKNIDIDTEMQGNVSGEVANVSQKPIGSVTTVQLKAQSNSVGLTLLLALIEQILDKTNSKEYELTYMHGATTIFGGLIHGISVEQGANDDLMRIKLEVSRGKPKTQSVVVQQDPSALRLASQGSTVPAGASTAAAGNTGTQIKPRMATP